MADANEITRLIEESLNGTVEEDALMAALYPEFRALAAHYMGGELVNHTLQPTALVSEAYMRLVDQERTDWQGKTHFFAVGAKMMRRVLVDHARQRRALKRGGDRQRIQLDHAIQISQKSDIDLLAVDEALAKLADIDARQAAIVEMRFFGGMTVQQVAEALRVSKRTVEEDWTMIKAWLRRELAAE